VRKFVVIAGDLYVDVGQRIMGMVPVRWKRWKSGGYLSA